MENKTLKHELIELNSYGDQRTMWDVDNEAEVAGAREHFNTLTMRGDMAFKTTRNPIGTEETEQITEFDAAAETIIMVRQIVGG